MGASSPHRGRGRTTFWPRDSLRPRPLNSRRWAGGRRQGGPSRGSPGGRRLRPPPGTSAEVGLQMFCTCLALAPGRGMWLQRGARRGPGGGSATRCPRRTQTSQGGGPSGQGRHRPASISSWGVTASCGRNSSPLAVLEESLSRRLRDLLRTRPRRLCGVREEPPPVGEGCLTRRRRHTAGAAPGRWRSPVWGLAHHRALTGLTWPDLCAADSLAFVYSFPPLDASLNNLLCCFSCFFFFFLMYWNALLEFASSSAFGFLRFVTLTSETLSSGTRVANLTFHSVFVVLASGCFH